MSFSRIPRLTSAVRALHTSAPARQPAANPTEIFQKAFGERAAAQTSPLVKNDIQDNREQFKANQVRLLPISFFFRLYTGKEVHRADLSCSVFFLNSY